MPVGLINNEYIYSHFPSLVTTQLCWFFVNGILLAGMTKSGAVPINQITDSASNNQVDVSTSID